MTKLSPYETHQLIKSAVPTAKTVYEKELQGQITLDEWLDLINTRERGQYEI